MSTNIGLLKFVLAKKIREVMVQENLTLKDLSHTANLSPSYLNEILAGKKYPRPEKLIQLANALKTTISQLTSTEMGSRLTPLSRFFLSDSFREFPFDLFGIDISTIHQMMVHQPEKWSNLTLTVMELARLYDVDYQVFSSVVLRVYQEVNRNYFSELEDLGRDCLLVLTKKYPELRVEDWVEILKSQGVSVVMKNFEEDLRSLSSLRREDELLINQSLSIFQKRFVLASEYSRLVGKFQTSQMRGLEFDVGIHEKIENFKADYLAGCLLLPSQKISVDIENIFNSTHWSPLHFENLQKAYQVTPAHLFFRLSQLLPNLWGLQDLFFIGFRKSNTSMNVEMDREYHLGRFHNPRGLNLKEDYCRRWVSLKVLDLMPPEKLGSVYDAQISRTIGKGDEEYLCLSVAYRGNTRPKEVRSLTLGLPLDQESRKRIKFLKDPALVNLEVGQTCQRCPREHCQERVAPSEYLDLVNLRRRQRRLIRNIQE